MYSSKQALGGGNITNTWFRNIFLCLYIRYRHHDSLGPGIAANIAMFQVDFSTHILMWLYRLVCNDSSGLKHTALNYVMKDFKQNTLTPPIPKSKMKLDHGFNHPAIACTLCPRVLLNEFDEDPQ